MNRFFISVATAALLASTAQAEDSYTLGDVVEDASFGLIKTNTDYAKVMFDRQEHVTNKQVKLLEFRKNGGLQNQSVYLGGRFIGTHMHENTDTDGKFPIISRIPNQHTSGTSGHESVINDASFQVTALPTSWLNAFVQGEYTEVEYPGQNQFQMRKYTATIGDLSEFPMYATIGRDTVNFGNFTSYAPFTHNHSSHYFWAQNDKPHLEIGFVNGGWEIAGTIMQSGRGNRVTNTPGSDGFDNFAFNIRKSFVVNDTISGQIGGGWLRSTIYDSTLAHHPPGRGALDNEINPALNAFGMVTIGNADLYAEHTRTRDEWPATGYHVLATTLQARYRHELWGMPGIASFMFSRGEQGANGTEWELMDQYVVGYEVDVHENLKLGAEYLYNKGFVPLIMPQFTGDKSVDAHTFLVGVEATF